MRVCRPKAAGVTRLAEKRREAIADADGGAKTPATAGGIRPGKGRVVATRVANGPDATFKNQVFLMRVGLVCM